MSEGRQLSTGVPLFDAEDRCVQEPQHGLRGRALYHRRALRESPGPWMRSNRLALAEERQGHRVKLVFNGDFNWFNASDSLFRAINNRVLDHTVSALEMWITNWRTPALVPVVAVPTRILLIRAWWNARTRIMERLQGIAIEHSGYPGGDCHCYQGIAA